MKPRLAEIIVVEGRYDKGAVQNAVDAVVVETTGFQVFRDGERLLFLRRLAQERGLILLMDSDGAGFVIRNYLKGALPKDKVKQAYIPDRYGKERRKRRPGREGKLGVEAMPPEIIVQALRKAGAFFLEEDSAPPMQPVTKQDFYADGLSGRPESARLRRALLRRLDLPEHMTANAMLQAVSLLCGYDGYKKALLELSETEET